MTNEEAVKELYEWLDGCCGGEEIDPTREALRMAIEALKAQIDTDTNVGGIIYRQAAIDLIEDIETEWLKGNIELIFAPAIKGLRALPSTQPDLSDYSDKLWRAAFERGKAEGKEERKTGRWIYGEDNLRSGVDGWFCSECEHFEAWDYSADMKSAELNLPNFCPNCGADMRGEKE